MSVVDKEQYNINDIHLSASERNILDILWKTKEKFVSTESFMTLLYSDRLSPPEDQIVKVTICRLRRKLRGTPYEILTLYGRGYKLEETSHVV